MAVTVDTMVSVGITTEVTVGITGDVLVVSSATSTVS
jgi:hypothetical protein